MRLACSFNACRRSATSRFGRVSGSQHPRPAATRRPATHTLRRNQGIRHVAARMSRARLFGGSPMAHILVLRATEKQCTTHARARGAGAHRVLCSSTPERSLSILLPYISMCSPAVRDGQSIDDGRHPVDSCRAGEQPAVSTVVQMSCGSHVRRRAHTPVEAASSHSPSLLRCPQCSHVARCQCRSLLQLRAVLQGMVHW